MNRENKRKTFEKGYYKTHRCNDTFSCRSATGWSFPPPLGGDHRNHCPNCLSSLHVDRSRETAPRIAAASWTPSGCGCGKKRSGR